MQQHSQIIELKDRLVQALDEQLNVKDTNEVNRIISILEHTHVTREDLEKTRLGKYINDLRKRTADKELAKRAKKLIKLWRDLTVVGGGGSSSTPNNNNNNISALTSPFNSNSISPHGYSVHNNNNNNNNVGAKNGKLNITTFNDSKLTPPNHHPALLRVKNQHGRLVSPQEKNKSYGNSSLSPAALLSPVSHNNNSKTNVSFRSQAQKNASPQPQNNNNNNELTNGHHHHPNHDNSPNSYQKRIIASNGLSPGLQNSKNLAKDGISPNAYRNRRVTPPTPNSGDMASTINNHHHQHQQHLSPSSSSSLSPLINNTGNKSSSAPSSQLCSPLAFTYSNESRDSFTNNTITHNHHHHNNNKNNNSYSNHHHQQQHHHHHATNFDFINDEDSNSSQFSCISNDYSAKSAEDQHRKRSRKRKIEDENDTLRENFNYVNYGGRRPQSTEELIEKFNIKLDPKIMRKNDSTQFESYSASSSPVLSKDGDLKSNAKLAKNGGTFYSNRNGFHSEENSLDGFGAGVSPENKPYNNNNISPPVRSKHKKDSFAAASWSRSKYHDVDVGEENSNEEEEEEFDEYNQSVIESPQTCDQTVKSPSSPLETESKTSEHKKKPKWIKSISKIEQEINEIIAKLPKINPDDITLMQQLPWDSEQEDDLANDDEVDHAPEKVDDRIATVEESQEEKTSDETDEEEYEPYEYYEDYDEEIEVEVDEDDELEKNGDDDDVGDHDDENVPNLSDNEETSFSDKNRETNTLCDTTKCDNTTINLNDDVDISVDADRTESMSVDDGEENPTTTIAKTAATAASSPLSTSTTNVQHDDHTLHADAINSSLDHSSNDHPDEPEKMSHETSINENNLKTDESGVIIEEKKKTPEEEKDDQQMLVEKNDQPEEHDETATTERSKASNDENDVNKAEDLKKSSKKIIKRVVVKKRRRCIGRLKVKKSLVDRLANEQWEGYNGCYDKDGIWREWNEMTSVYVLTGGENANNHSEENVLHILPYVNCSW